MASTHCSVRNGPHDWRLVGTMLDKRITGINPADPRLYTVEEVLVDEWYCTACRIFETTDRAVEVHPDTPREENLSP